MFMICRESVCPRLQLLELNERLSAEDRVSLSSSFTSASLQDFMSALRLKLTAAELLLLSFCLLTLTGRTSGLENGSAGSRVVVFEDSDVILPCSLSTKENIESKMIDWRKDRRENVFFYHNGIYSNAGPPGQHEQFRGRVFHFPDELQHGNASIIIRKTKLVDSGNYTCDFPRLQPPQTSHIELVVEPVFKDRSGEIPGASPEPYIRILTATADGVLLQCEVRGASPKPEVEWRDSAGNILPAEEPQVTERGGRFNVSLQATVTKTDRYRCVVKQDDINHLTAAEAFVPFYEKVSEDTSSKVIAGCLFGGWVSGVLTLAAILASLVATKCITIQRNNGSPEQRNGSYEAPPEMTLNGLLHIEEER